MRKLRIIYIVPLVSLPVVLPLAGLCAEATLQEEVYDMGRINVTAQRGTATVEPVSVDPQKSTIRLGDYKSVAIPQNAGDLVKELVIMDHSGATGLVPDDDTLSMRGGFRQTIHHRH